MDDAGAGGDEATFDSDREDDASGGGDGGGGGGGRRPRRSAGPFYAVAVGRKTGVFRTWDAAEPSVRAFSGAVYKKFSTEREARAFVQSRAPPAATPAGGAGDGVTSAAAVVPLAPNPLSPSGHVGPFYAVARGHKVGVFTTWAEAQGAIKGASGAMYKRFNTRQEAEGFLEQYRLPTRRTGGAGAAALDVGPAGDSAAGAAPAPAARKRGRPKKADPAAAATVPSGGADAPGATAERGESVSGAGGAPGAGAAVARAEGEVEDVGAQVPSAAAEAFTGPALYGPQWQRDAPIYYAVARGKQAGIFTSWPDARAAVEGVRDARFKRFKRLPDAYAYLAEWAASEQPAPVLLPAGELPAGGIAGASAGGSGSGGGSDSGSARLEPGAGGGGGCEGGRDRDAAAGVWPDGAAEAWRGDAPEGQGGQQGQRQQRQGEEVGGDAVQEEAADGDGGQQLLHFGSLSGVVDPARRYRLEFDGGSRRNPGDAGFGAVLAEEASGLHVEYVAGPLASSSNNVAEWSALAAGMQAAVDMGVRHLVVQGDSELVCRQVSGRYGVNTAALQPLAARVSRLRSQLESFEVVHVPRAQNAAADLLSNYAMDAEEAVAAVAGVGVAPSRTGDDDDEAQDGRAWQRELLRPTILELGEAALQTARAAVAASAAAALSDSVLSTSEAAAKPAASGGGRALGRGRSGRGPPAARGRGRRADVVVTECRPPLAARGSAAGSLQEFNRVLIALACAGHGLLD